MPKKQTDSAMLAQIREVITDMHSGFKVRCYKDLGGNVNKGDLDRLGGDLAVEIIENILNGTTSDLTKDYRKTKRDAAKAAQALAL